MLVKTLQRKYIFFGAALLPVAPFLYLQGRYTRFKVGRLPDAEGDTSGVIGKGELQRLLLIGESTVAGVGARNHEEALSGQFAKHLSNKTSTRVEWNAIGKSGITIAETLVELVPKIERGDYNMIVVALGGNDLFSVRSPAHWRRKLTELLGILREKSPDAEIFLANIPMVRDFTALPDPLRYLLSRLAKMQHFNTIDLVSDFERVFYFHDVQKVDDDFFSDGVHPSASGYDSWAEAMVDLYLKDSGRVGDGR